MSKNLAEASNEWKLATKNLADLNFSIVKALRCGQDEDAIESYLRDWSQLPPIDVFFDGKTYWGVDGGHRGAAGELGNKKTIKCRIKSGAKREAELEAMGRNEHHGVRRTNEEKRKIVEKLLNDPEWGKRSQRWIADAAKVDRRMVSAIIKELSGESDDEPSSIGAPASASGGTNVPAPLNRPTEIEGRDGRPYPARQPIPKPTGKRKKSGAKMGFDGPQARGPQVDEYGNELVPAGGELYLCDLCGEMVPEGHDGACVNNSQDDVGTGATAPSDAPRGSGDAEQPGLSDAGRAAPDDGPLPGKPAPAQVVETPRVRVPVRVDLAEFEIAALHCVTEPDPTLHAELFDDWEATEGHGECPEADARAAVLKLGVRFE